MTEEHRCATCPMRQKAEDTEQESKKRQEKPAEVDQAGRGPHEILESGVSGGDHSEVGDRQTESGKENRKRNDPAISTVENELLSRDFNNG